MKEHAWTIGSLPDCDIRVESLTVSGRHCRLTQRGPTYLIEDLGSTNGTFVAGEQIDGPREVGRGEQIMLGMTTPMPWPNLGSITIGRLPDNDVVIPLDMVSSHHARLEREGDCVYLVDLDSRNGTALNDPLNKIRRGVIRPTDVVFFGTHKIMAADLFAALPTDVPEPRDARQATKMEAAPLAALEPRPMPVTRGPWIGDYRSVRAWAIGVGLSAAFVLLAFAASSAFHRPNEEAKGNTQRPSTPASDNAVTSSEHLAPVPPVHKEVPAPAPSEFDEQAIRQSEKGVYLVCCRRGQTVVFLQEATAWAIAPDTIICPSSLLGQFDKMRVKDGKHDECIVVCNPLRALRIDDHPPGRGDGAFLSISHLDEHEERALTVAADRDAASSFDPRTRQTLAMIVARGRSAGDQPDDPKQITTRLVRLTVDQVLLDDRKSPRGLYCTAAEDVGAAVPAPVFDGAGHLVGCVDSAKKTQVRVTLLRHLPSLISAIP